LFDWNDADINILLSLGPFGFVLFTFINLYLIEKYSFRICMLINSLLILFGAIIRLLTCFTVLKSYYLLINIVGLSFNGIAGPFAMSIPTTFSVLWFPVKQRATATSLITAGYNLNTFAFLIGPSMINKNNSTNYN